MRELIVLMTLFILLGGCGKKEEGTTESGNSTTEEEEVISDPPANCSTDPELIGTWKEYPLERASITIDEFCVIKGGQYCKSTVYMQETRSNQNLSKSIQIQVVKTSGADGCLPKGTYSCSYKWYYNVFGDKRFDFTCPGVSGVITYEKF
jgi:hypothetical protein